MSASLRKGGITGASAVQGPGASLPSLVFKDTPMVVAPDIVESDELVASEPSCPSGTPQFSACQVCRLEGGTRVSRTWVTCQSFSSLGGRYLPVFPGDTGNGTAGLVSQAEEYRFRGPLGKPLAKYWSEAAVYRLANTLGTKGLKLKVAPSLCVCSRAGRAWRSRLLGPSCSRSWCWTITACTAVSLSCWREESSGSQSLHRDCMRHQDAKRLRD